MRTALLLCLLIAAPALACMREPEPTPAEYFVRRATRELSDRKYEEALKSARVVLEPRPALTEADGMKFYNSSPVGPASKSTLKAARRVKALSLVRLQRMTEARPAMDKALAESPDDPQLICRMAEVEIAEGKESAALARLEPLAEKDLLPDAYAHLALARARNAAGNISGAKEEVAAALRQDRDLIGAKALRGVLDAATPQATAQR